MKDLQSLLAQKLARLNSIVSTQASDNGATVVQCSLCQDKGLILEGDVAKQCICVRQRALLRRFKAANMSEHMRKLRFEDFSKEYYGKRLDPLSGKTFEELAVSSLKMAQEFVAANLKGRGKEGIMFSGPVGSGKTFLACCIANALVESQKQVLFVVVPDLLDEIKASWDKQSAISEHELMEAARTVDILILDDMGAHNYTDWTRNKLYSIINYRYNYQLPTIITTNLNYEALSEQIGERSTSRLVMMCKLARLACDRDIRLQVRARKNQDNRINRTAT